MYEEFPSKQFSGGLDSAVIAALADRLVPAGEQIDLINVAFAKTAMVFELKGFFCTYKSIVCICISSQRIPSTQPRTG